MLIISTEACQLSVALSGRFHAGSEILLITNLFFHFSPLRRWIIATYRLVQSVYVHPACPKWWYTPKCFCFVSSMSTYFDPGPIEKDPPKQRDCVYIYIRWLCFFEILLCGPIPLSWPATNFLGQCKRLTPSASLENAQCHSILLVLAQVVLECQVLVGVGNVNLAHKPPEQGGGGWVPWLGKGLVRSLKCRFRSESLWN